MKAAALIISGLLITNGYCLKMPSFSKPAPSHGPAGAGHSDGGFHMPHLPHFHHHKKHEECPRLSPHSEVFKSIESKKSGEKIRENGMEWQVSSLAIIGDPGAVEEPIEAVKKGEDFIKLVKTQQLPDKHLFVCQYAWFKKALTPDVRAKLIKENSNDKSKTAVWFFITRPMKAHH